MKTELLLQQNEVLRVHLQDLPSGRMHARFQDFSCT